MKWDELLFFNPNDVECIVNCMCNNDEEKDNWGMFFDNNYAEVIRTLCEVYDFDQDTTTDTPRIADYDHVYEHDVYGEHFMLRYSATIGGCLALYKTHKNN